MIKLINDDCVNIMKDYKDNEFDLAIVDPPYGLGKRLSQGAGKLKKTKFRVLYEKKDWDIKPNKDYWQELFRVSKNQIVCGANYFIEHLPNTRGIVCWDKKQHMPTFSRWEFIWTSFDKPAKIFEKMSNDNDRFHPTQKPIDLYKWLLHNYSEKGQKILDTHLGSGSIAVAAHYFGVDLVGIEIDEEYFTKAKQRIDNLTKQETLF